MISFSASRLRVSVASRESRSQRADVPTIMITISYYFLFVILSTLAFLPGAVLISLRRFQGESKNPPTRRIAAAREKVLRHQSYRRSDFPAISTIERMYPIEEGCTIGCSS